MAFQFPSFLVVEDGAQMKDRDGIYRYTSTDLIMFEPGAIVPLINIDRGCVGLATIAEVHINRYGSTIFYKINGRIDQKFKNAYYQLYAMTDPNARPITTPGSAGRTFAASAVGMDMGANYSPREILEGYRNDDDEDGYPRRKNRGLTDNLDLEDF